MFLVERQCVLLSCSLCPYVRFILTHIVTFRSLLLSLSNLILVLRMKSQPIFTLSWRKVIVEHGRCLDIFLAKVLRLRCRIDLTFWDAKRIFSLLGVLRIVSSRIFSRLFDIAWSTACQNLRCILLLLISKTVVWLDFHVGRVQRLRVIPLSHWILTLGLVLIWLEGIGTLVGRNSWIYLERESIILQNWVYIWLDQANVGITLKSVLLI